MDRVTILALSTLVLACLIQSSASGETILSSVLNPKKVELVDKSAQSLKLSRQGRSYYDPRYGGRPERLEYERPTRCGRCQDDDRDDGFDRDRGRDRDRFEDRRPSHRPTYGSKYDRNEEDGERRGNSNKNGTEEEGDPDKKRPYDDKDNSSGSRGRDRHRNRFEDRDSRDRYDDRDRYRPDYYDRFLRDPYRERYNDRPYDDSYRERRPSYDRYPDRYEEGGYGGRYDGYGYPGYRRPAQDDRYNRGFEDSYGGYGPSSGRGQHDSFRPWDETYRGQAGWDEGGRGYYFASGRPEAASGWGRPQPQYSRPESSGWQNGYASGYSGSGYGSGNGYSTGYPAANGYGGGVQSGGVPAAVYGAGGGYRGNGYSDPVDYRGSVGGQDYGYRQDLSTSYGRPSGWHSVGERRPYRDQSGVNRLDGQGNLIQPSRNQGFNQDNRQQSSYQPNPGTNAYSSSSTTPGTSYLYQRKDEQVTSKSADQTTNTPS